MGLMDNHVYKTSDTALAAFLITRRYYLLSIDYSQPRYEWLFRDSEDIRDDANKYLTGNSFVDPATYSRIFRKANRVLRKNCQWSED